MLILRPLADNFGEKKGVKLKVRIFCETDVGKSREINQDAYIARVLEGGAALAVVCDGMGGANAGNIASAKATKTIYDYVLRSWQPGMSASQIKNLLCSAVMSANLEVFDAASKNEELKGMGTTVVAVIATKAVSHIVHVGDSRAYIIRDNTLSQITTDHSMVQRMIESGQLTADEAKSDPRKNIITRALGVEEDLNIDYNELDLCDKDMLLICTDGLSNMLSSEEILKIVSQSPCENATAQLVSAANEVGGSDNITAVLILSD